jgi:hypothetical protein
MKVKSSEKKLFSGTKNELIYLLRRFEEKEDEREHFINMNKKETFYNKIQKGDLLLSVLPSL